MKIMKTLLATVTAVSLCSCGAGIKTAEAKEMTVKYSGIEFQKPLYLEEEEIDSGLFYSGYADEADRDKIYYYITTGTDYRNAVQEYFPFEESKSSVSYIQGRETGIDGVDFHIREGNFHAERYVRVGECSDLYFIECTGEADGQTITAVAFSETNDKNIIKEMRKLFC